jgi:hypothetical protein
LKFNVKIITRSLFRSCILFFDKMSLLIQMGIAKLLVIYLKEMCNLDFDKNVVE